MQQHALKHKQQQPRSRTSHAAKRTRSAQRTAHPVMQVQNIIGNHGVLRHYPDVIQPKLKVGAPNDRYEQEADRVAEQVMRMTDPTIARRLEGPPTIQRTCAACASGQGPCSECAEEEETLQRKPLAATITPLIQRQGDELEEEEEEEMLQAKEMPGQTVEAGDGLTSRLRGLRGGGRPLPGSVRAFFEPRFGADFSWVRIHTDGRAAETARLVNARAFTVGRDVVFGAGQYAPDAPQGQRLLAHELTHVVQQGKSPVLQSVQRACGSKQIDEPSGCTFIEGEVGGPRYLFNVNCNVFAPGNEDDLRADARRIQEGDTVEVHGLASIDGDATYNLHLSCARALRAKKVIEEVLAVRGVTATIRVFNHGARSGDATQQRSVVVTRTTPPPPEPESICGPDATDWLIRQINAAKTDATVLALKSRLAGAERLARRFGFSAEDIAEGAVAKRVLAEETRVGSPTRTTGAQSQITASVPGQRAFGRALIAAPVPIVGGPEALVLAAIRGAALTWKGLVGTGRRYDFKNDSRTMRSPTSANCPDNCANTITLCPTSSSDCFRTDVPGNIFYAHVGRFVGWTELALQLGSQFAQLESTSRWDPPEDTRMISFAFALPDPLSQSALCSAINANRTIFSLQECDNCSEVTTAAVV